MIKQIIKYTDNQLIVINQFRSLIKSIVVTIDYHFNLNCYTMNLTECQLIDSQLKVSNNLEVENFKISLERSK